MSPRDISCLSSTIVVQQHAAAEIDQASEIKPNLPDPRLAQHSIGPLRPASDQQGGLSRTAARSDENCCLTRGRSDVNSSEGLNKRRSKRAYRNLPLSMRNSSCFTHDLTCRMVTTAHPLAHTRGIFSSLQMRALASEISSKQMPVNRGLAAWTRSSTVPNIGVTAHQDKSLPT